MKNNAITVIACIRAKEGKEPQVREALLKLLAPTRREAGCINYDLHLSPDDPGLFLFHENWRSREALAANLESAHVAELRDRTDELLAEPVEITVWDRIG